MTAYWWVDGQEGPEDPDAIDVTGLGDPVRSFISLREPSAAELAEFRALWLIESAFVQRGPVGAVIPPLEKARRRGQCQGCGMDDSVDIWSKCRYCAELGALRAGQAAPPWRFIPANLLITDLLAIVLVVTGVCAIVYAISNWL